MIKTKFGTKYNQSRRATSTRGAFTLVEVLVALAVMMLLLTIILVPVNMALDVFHIGKARNDVQQANRLVINQIAADLRRAVFVYPNEQMPGITDKAPYTSNSNQPYYQTGTGGVSNTSRIDMLLPAQDGNGAVVTPTQATNYIVTYYARRFDTSKAYDEYANPVVLFRAQYPFKGDDGSTSASYSSTGSTRYSDLSLTSSKWLTQNENAEPDLESLAAYSTVTQSASHIQITPRDMSLIAANATATTPNYQPDTTFTCDDVNADGKIDRVTVSINQAKYDALGARSENQRLRSTQVIDLPNVK